MTKIFVVILSLVIVLGLAACKQTSKATIYNDKAEVLKVIDDSKEISEIVDAWKAKNRALEKILPIFEYSIELDVDGEKQVWQFNQGGYLKKKGDNLLYKTPKKEVLAQYIK